MPTFPDLRPEEILFLTRLGNENSRAMVEPGEYEFDLTVRVAGAMKIAEPHEARNDQKVPWRRIAMVALSKLNARTLVKVLDQAIEDDDGYLDHVSPAAAEIADALLEGTTDMRDGAVRVEAVVERRMKRVEPDLVTESTDSATA